MQFAKVAVLGIALGFFVSVAAFKAHAQQTVDGFVARKYSASTGATMPYRLFIPHDYDQRQSYPLIVFLHGGGGNGSDNLKQISGGNTNGTHLWTNQDVQKTHPTFVLAPQTPEGGTWGGPEAAQLSSSAQMMLEIIDTLEHEFNIDKTRLYITGQSLGGFGTWDVIIRRPQMFAAAVPLCGSGIVNHDPFRRLYSDAEFERIKDMPIWVFQGAGDTDVPAGGPRKTVATLRKLGSTVRYTEYPNVGHRVWEHAYLDRALIAWVFVQRKS